MDNFDVYLKYYPNYKVKEILKSKNIQIRFYCDYFEIVNSKTNTILNKLINCMLKCDKTKYTQYNFYNLLAVTINNKN